MNYNREPHPHAEVIKAWADGAFVQVRDPSFSNPVWTDCNQNNPGWHQVGVEFRVKPEKVIRYVPIMRTPKRKLAIGYGVTTKDWAKQQVGMLSDVIGILRIELDPDSGEPMSVQLEK